MAVVCGSDAAPIKEASPTIDLSNLIGCSFTGDIQLLFSPECAEMLTLSGVVSSLEPALLSMPQRGESRWEKSFAGIFADGSPAIGE